MSKVNVCRYCGEIPEDCTCSRGKDTDKDLIEGIKEIRRLAESIIDTADDQLKGPRDRPDIGCVISDCAGLGETINIKADKLMFLYEEREFGRGQ